jgi:hypothetical protein
MHVIKDNCDINTLINKIRSRRSIKMEDPNEPKTTTIAETDTYLAWKAEEPDGETTYHLELNNITLHFFTEEWKEFLDLVDLILDEEV